MTSYKNDPWTLHHEHLGIKVYKHDENGSFSAYLWSYTDNNHVELEGETIEEINQRIAIAVAPNLYACLESIRGWFGQDRFVYEDPIENTKLLGKAIKTKIDELW